MATLRSKRSPVVRTYHQNTLRSLRSPAVTGAMPPPVEGAFTLFRGYEGVQLVLNWSVPTGGYDRVIIRRKLDNWPDNIEDGTQIIDESAPFVTGQYSDRQLEAYRVYYYVMFVHRPTDDAWFTKRGWRGKLFPLPTGYFEGALWQRLPQLYPREDGEG